MDGSRSFFSHPFQPAAVRNKHEALDRLEEQITELWGHLNAATYRFLVLVAEFDRNKAYERHGLVCTAQWLNWQCGIGKVAAREKVRVARALESVPEISAAFASGEFSYSKVRAMTRVATAANESVLVSIGRYGTATHVERLVKKYRWTQRRDATTHAHSQQLNRQVHCFYDASDTFVLHARLPPEIGALIVKALETAGDILHEASKIERSADTQAQVSAGTWAISQQEDSYAARRADALRHVAETFLACSSEEAESTTSADRYQVVVHVDQAVLTERIVAAGSEPHRCELDDGAALALDTVRRLACDGTVVGILEGRDGEPLNIGRKTRIIPLPLKRALRARDGGCRFPGCDRTRFTEGHHVKHWADGGETKLANLVTLCGLHHRLMHEGGFGVGVTHDGVFVFTRPDGQPIPKCGTPRVAVALSTTRDRTRNTDDRDERFRGSVGGESPDRLPNGSYFEETLRFHMQHLSPDARIDAHTSRCKWLGESMDYSIAIEAMQSREARGRD